MKRLFLIAALALSGCEFSRSTGKCIGLADKERAKVEYEVSTRNVIVALVFSGSILVPGFVVLTDYKCPVEN